MQSTGYVSLPRDRKKACGHEFSVNDIRIWLRRAAIRCLLAVLEGVQDERTCEQVHFFFFLSFIRRTCEQVFLFLFLFLPFLFFSFLVFRVCLVVQKAPNRRLSAPQRPMPKP